MLFERKNMNKSISPSIEQKEDAKHGEIFFPIQKYITKLKKDYPVVTTHWNDEGELTMVTSGKCTFQIDLIDYEVSKGDILFVPPLYIHSFNIGENKKFDSETYVFHFNFLGGNSTDICATKYLTPIINQEITMPYLIKPNHPAYDSLRKAFNQISQLYNEKISGYELELKALLLQVIFILLQYSEKNPAREGGNPSEKIKTVLDYIEHHFKEQITVSQLAKLCYFSNYHFMRFFKKHMNMTCIEYINNVRLEKAVEMFEHGNTSIMDVSMSVGYNNLSYFHRAFKKKYGITPLSFIKALDNH